MLCFYNTLYSLLLFKLFFFFKKIIFFKLYSSGPMTGLSSMALLYFTSRWNDLFSSLGFIFHSALYSSFFSHLSIFMAYPSRRVETLTLLNTLVQTRLLNQWSLMHPLLVLSLLIFSGILFGVYTFSSAYFYKYLSTARPIGGIFFIISLSALCLGSMWAQQELNWGGWWNWDLVEVHLLFYFIVALRLIHNNNSLYISIAPWGLPILILFCLLKGNLVFSIHSFARNKFLLFDVYLSITSLYFLYMLRPVLPMRSYNLIHYSLLYVIYIILAPAVVFLFLSVDWDERWISWAHKWIALSFAIIPHMFSRLSWFTIIPTPFSVSFFVLFYIFVSKDWRSHFFFLFLGWISINPSTTLVQILVFESGAALQCTLAFYSELEGVLLYSSSEILYGLLWIQNYGSGFLAELFRLYSRLDNIPLFFLHICYHNRYNIVYFAAYYYVWFVLLPPLLIKKKNFF